MCHLYYANTIGAMILTPLTGKAQQRNKIREIYLLALQICPALPKGVVSAPRFVYERRVQRSTLEIWQNQDEDKIKQ
jgi:hypothetical protein